MPDCARVEGKHKPATHSAPAPTTSVGRRSAHSPTSSPHLKSNHSAYTPDGWRLHIVRTTSAGAELQGQAEGKQNRNHHARSAPLQPTPWRGLPVILVPGLGSSGAYTYDLSPAVSLADYLASDGYDVWTIELRGNGQSDKPNLLTRSRWWTVDDYVEVDFPTALQYVLQATQAPAVHVMAHSMGGMILTRVLARRDATAQRVASATIIGSGCFLKGSWWQALEGSMWLARYLPIVPAGSTLRLYSNLSFTRLAVPLLDRLYFWPYNTNPVLARAVLARNFSAISSGVILQLRTAFGERGLLAAGSTIAKAATAARGDASKSSTTTTTTTTGTMPAAQGLHSQHCQRSTQGAGAADDAAAGDAAATAVTGCDGQSTQRNRHHQHHPQSQSQQGQEDAVLVATPTSGTERMLHHVPHISTAAGTAAATSPSSPRTLPGQAYADPGLLWRVTTPVMFIVGDRDRMCPPEGCRRTFELFGSPDKVYVELGPCNGQRHHYGHFDILMGNHVEEEVFPQLKAWLNRHDPPRQGPEAAVATGSETGTTGAPEVVPASAAARGGSSTGCSPVTDPGIPMHDEVPVPGSSSVTGFEAGHSRDCGSSASSAAPMLSLQPTCGRQHLAGARNIAPPAHEPQPRVSATAMPCSADDTAQLGEALSDQALLQQALQACASSAPHHPPEQPSVSREPQTNTPNMSFGPGLCLRALPTATPGARRGRQSGSLLPRQAQKVVSVPWQAMLMAPPGPDSQLMSANTATLLLSLAGHLLHNAADDAAQPSSSTPSPPSPSSSAAAGSGGASSLGGGQAAGVMVMVANTQARAVGVVQPGAGAAAGAEPTIAHERIAMEPPSRLAGPATVASVAALSGTKQTSNSMSTARSAAAGITSGMLTCGMSLRAHQQQRRHQLHQTPHAAGRGDHCAPSVGLMGMTGSHDAMQAARTTAQQLTHIANDAGRICGDGSKDIAAAELMLMRLHLASRL